MPVKDHYSPFRYYLRIARKRDPDHDLTLPFLKDLWEEQQGICVYSGVGLVPYIECQNHPIYTASLDRIDSSLGYCQNNVQFISIAMNWMKASMSDSEVVKLLRLITANRIQLDNICPDT
jgi:hypothetical protein